MTRQSVVDATRNIFRVCMQNRQFCLHATYFCPDSIDSVIYRAGLCKSYGKLLHRFVVVELPTVRQTKVDFAKPCTRKKLDMTCMVETYNPHITKFGSVTLYREEFEDEESRLVQLLSDIPPSALHSQSAPTDGVRNLPRAHRYESNDDDGSVEEVIPAVLQSFDSGLGFSDSSIVDLTEDQNSSTVQPPWWESELASDIHQTLRQREKELAPIQFQSPQLKQRQYLVDFLYMVSGHLQLSRGTRFLAISLMDRFMDKHIVMEYRLKLVALTSLLVAAKLEDKEDQLPSIEQMQHLARLGNPEHYTVDEFQKMELYLLRFFNWSVSHPTPAHYADYFLTHGNALDSENPSTSPAATMDPVTRRIQMEKYNTYFIEAALRDYTFLQYAPSLVAAAAVCASRMCIGISTAWNKELEMTTGYQLPELFTVVERMLRIQEKNSC